VKIYKEEPKLRKNVNKNKQRVKKQHTYTTYTKQDTFSIYDIIETIDEKKRKKNRCKITMTTTL